MLIWYELGENELRNRPLISPKNKISRNSLILNNKMTSSLSPKAQFKFQSTSFNYTEVKPYFINDCCFGDDLCRWLIARLVKNGYNSDTEPSQEDFGWYFHFQVADIIHRVIIGFQPNSISEGDCWLVWIERPGSFFGYLFREKYRKIHPEAIAAINGILSTTTDVSHLVRYEN